MDEPVIYKIGNGLVAQYGGSLYVNGLGQEGGSIYVNGDHQKGEGKLTDWVQKGSKAAWQKLKPIAKRVRDDVIKAAKDRLKEELGLNKIEQKATEQKAVEPNVVGLGMAKKSKVRLPTQYDTLQEMERGEPPHAGIKRVRRKRSKPLSEAQKAALERGREIRLERLGKKSFQHQRRQWRRSRKS